MTDQNVLYALSRNVELVKDEDVSDADREELTKEPVVDTEFASRLFYGWGERGEDARMKVRDRALEAIMEDPRVAVLRQEFQGMRLANLGGGASTFEEMEAAKTKAEAAWLQARTALKGPRGYGTGFRGIRLWWRAVEVCKLRVDVDPIGAEKAARLIADAFYLADIEEFGGTANAMDMNDGARVDSTAADCIDALDNTVALAVRTGIRWMNQYALPRGMQENLRYTAPCDQDKTSYVIATGIRSTITTTYNDACYVRATMQKRRPEEAEIAEDLIDFVEMIEEDSIIAIPDHSPSTASPDLVAQTPAYRLGIAHDKPVYREATAEEDIDEWYVCFERLEKVEERHAHSGQISAIHKYTATGESQNVNLRDVVRIGGLDWETRNRGSMTLSNEDHELIVTTILGT